MNLSVVARIYQLRRTLRFGDLLSLIAALSIQARAVKPVIRKSH